MDKEYKVQGISGWILKLFGWKTYVNYSPSIRKMIYIVAPHTSNWDFPIGILVRKAIGVKCFFVGKHTLFRFPLGILMRWLNGIPLNRKTSKNFVDQVVDIYNDHDDLIIQLAPEGTRKKVEHFKTGFYHIAKKANIPIIPIFFDWGNKRLVFNEAFYPTEDSKADLKYLEDMFRGIVGKIPKNSF